MKNEVHAKLVAGISLVGRKPCFSPDSKYLLVPAENGIKVFVVNTGEWLHDLFTEQQDVIICFINPRNALQAISVSVDGYICYWNYEDGVLVRKYHVDGPVLTGIPHEATNQIYLVKDTSKTEKTKVLALVTLDRNAVADSACTTVMSLGDIPTDKFVAINAKLGLIAVCQWNIVTIHDFKSKKRRESRQETNYSNCSFVCVEWHPTDNAFATGDEEGRLMFWSIGRGGNYSFTYFHWHCGAVRDLAFSMSGTFVHSVGPETVLLRWCPKAQGDQKLTIPRLGMEQLFVVCSTLNDYVAVSYVDNCINILEADSMNRETMTVIQGLCNSNLWNPEAAEPVPTGMLLDPRSGCLVINGRIGHLQFYDLFEDKHLYNLDITNTNIVSIDKNKTKIDHLNVTRAAFDLGGDWLATVEYWCDGKLSPIVRLKFWQFVKEFGRYNLSTTIEYPHSGVVNTLLFQPWSVNLDDNQFGPIAVTTGDDKRIRFWHLAEEETYGDKEYVWCCAGEGLYCGLPPTAACFSQDGTVLAVAFGSNLTLWEVATSMLRTSLSHPFVASDIRQIVFGRDYCSHLVVCTTKNSLNVWDTLTLSILWSVQNNITYVATDFASENMAAFTSDGNLFVFKPSKAEPVHIYDNVCKGGAIGATFLPQRKRKADGSYIPWLQKSELIFMDQEQKLYTLCSNDAIEERSNEKVKIQQHVTLTPFSLLLAEQRKSGVEIVEQKFHELLGSGNKKIVKEILFTPAQVLPAPADLCKTLLNSLLKPLNDRPKAFGSYSDESDDDSGLDARSTDDTDSDSERPKIGGSRGKKDIVAETTLTTATAQDSSTHASVLRLPNLADELLEVATENYRFLF